LLFRSRRYFDMIFLASTPEPRENICFLKSESRSYAFNMVQFTVLCVCALLFPQFILFFLLLSLLFCQFFSTIIFSSFVQSLHKTKTHPQRDDKCCLLLPRGDFSSRQVERTAKNCLSTAPTSARCTHEMKEEKYQMVGSVSDSAFN
jgi:hypothetical protein